MEQSLLWRLWTDVPRGTSRRIGGGSLMVFCSRECPGNRVRLNIPISKVPRGTFPCSNALQQCSNTPPDQVGTDFNRNLDCKLDSARIDLRRSYGSVNFAEVWGNVGKNYRYCESKRRSWKDHNRSKFGGMPRCRRTAYPACRLRFPRKRNVGDRIPQGSFPSNRLSLLDPARTF